MTGLCREMSFRVIAHRFSTSMKPFCLMLDVNDDDEIWVVLKCDLIFIGAREEYFSRWEYSKLFL